MPRTNRTVENNAETFHLYRTSTSSVDLIYQIRIIALDWDGPGCWSLDELSLPWAVRTLKINPLTEFCERRLNRVYVLLIPSSFVCFSHLLLLQRWGPHLLGPFFSVGKGPFLHLLGSEIKEEKRIPCRHSLPLTHTRTQTQSFPAAVLDGGDDDSEPQGAVRRQARCMRNRNKNRQKSSCYSTVHAASIPVPKPVSCSGLQQQQQSTMATTAFCKFAEAYEQTNTTRHTPLRGWMKDEARGNEQFGRPLLAHAGPHSNGEIILRWCFLFFFAWSFPRLLHGLGPDGQTSILRTYPRSFFPKHAPARAVSCLTQFSPLLGSVWELFRCLRWRTEESSPSSL